MPTRTSMKTKPTSTLMSCFTARNGLLLIAVFSLTLMGCNASKALKGAGIGAGAGAIIGGAIGKASGETAKGAIIGAAVGGSAGAIIGNEMDKQARELEEELENARVERVGEGIQITFDAAILFAVDSSELSEASKANLDNLANSLQEYPNTNILVVGHTDNTGAESYNQALSERRAGSAAAYLAQQDIATTRLAISGLGETTPIADNATTEGRRQNRRVEVAITATEEYRESLEANSGN